MIIPNKTDPPINIDFSILDSCISEIYIFDTISFKYEFVNKSALNNLGFSIEDMTQRTIFDLQPNLNFDSFSQFLQPLLNGELEKLEKQVTQQRANNSQYTAQATFNLIRSKGNTLIFSEFTNISNKENSDIQFWTTTEQLQNIFNYSGIGSALLNDKSQFIMTNKAFQEILGYTEEDLNKMTLQNITHPNDINQSFDHSLDIHKGKEKCAQMEQRYLHKKGHYIWCSICLTTIQNIDKNSFVSIIQIIDISERKRTEEALCISEANLLNALKMAKLGTWEYDVLKDLFTFNDNFYDIYKVTAKDVGGYTMSSYEYSKRFVHPEEAEIIEIEFEKAIKTSDPFFSRYLEHRFLYGDGSEGIIAVRFFVIKGENGKTIKIYGINQEISELGKIEKSLKEEQSLLRSIVDNLPIALYIKDIEGRKVLVNPIDALNIGKEESEIIGKTDLDLFSREIAEHTYKDDISVIKTGQTIINREEFIINHKGESKWLITSKIPWKNFEGKVIGLIGTGLDITERKRSEELLIEERALLRNILDNLPIALYVKDNNGYKLLTNPIDAIAIGKEESEIIGKTDLDLFTKEIAENTYKDDLEVINTGQPIIKEELIVNHKGEVRWFFTTKIPRKNREGKIIGLLGMGLDITTRKKEEEELIKAKNKAEESDKLKSSFLANMSHEIRTPMNAIIGFSDLIIRPNQPEERKAKFSILIKERAYDLLRIIEDILDISKIEIGQMSLYEESTNIEQLLNNIYEYYSLKKENLKSNNVKFSINYGSGIKDLEIKLDEQRLKQILINFIDNALKFTKEGSVDLSCRIADKKELIFCVADTGIGISREKYDIIFDRFRQAEDSLTTRNFGGSGLGLSIAKGLSELMGGKIWFESRVNIGTKFYFSILINKEIN